MNVIKNCPICNATEFAPFIKAIDYTVSHEVFSIVRCTACDFHFTNPIPSSDRIGDFYKAESYVSHSSSTKGLINKLYQQVRKHTLQQKLKLITRLAKGKAILDIGAGTGHFLNVCQKAGWETLGLEPDTDARNFAKKEFDVTLFSTVDLHTLPKASRDVVTMWHVLEHVYNLKRDLTQIVDVLKDDGVLIVAVPNRNSYDALHYKEYWAAYDLPIHLYHFVPDDIKNLFMQFDMEVVEILPMKFDSYYVAMLSEKYKGGNMMKAFLTGFRSNRKAKHGTYSSQIYILKKKRV